jgi:hypothetical protein
MSPSPPPLSICNKNDEVYVQNDVSCYHAAQQAVHTHGCRPQDAESAAADGWQRRYDESSIEFGCDGMAVLFGSEL